MKILSATVIIMDFGCQRKRSDSMHVKLGIRHINMDESIILLGTTETQKAMFTKLDLRSPMHGDFMICWVMYGNGVGIFTTRWIMAIIEYLEAAAGLKRRGDAVQPVDVAVIQHLELMILVFGSQGPIKASQTFSL